MLPGCAKELWYSRIFLMIYSENNINISTIIIHTILGQYLDIVAEQLSTTTMGTGVSDITNPGHYTIKIHTGILIKGFYLASHKCGLKISQERISVEWTRENWTKI